MIVKVGDDKYGVYFRHEQFKTPILHTRVNGKHAAVKVITHCVVTDLKEKNSMKIFTDDWPFSKVLSYGRARCSEEDNFDRPFGREHSMTKALKPFSKGIRTAVWDKYWEIHKGPYAEDDDDQVCCNCGGVVVVDDSKDAECASHEIIDSVVEE